MCFIKANQVLCDLISINLFNGFIFLVATKAIACEYRYKWHYFKMPTTMPSEHKGNRKFRINNWFQKYTKQRLTEMLFALLLFIVWCLPITKFDQIEFSTNDGCGKWFGKRSTGHLFSNDPRMHETRITY